MFYNMEGFKYGIVMGNECTVSVLLTYPSDPQEKKVHFTALLF